MTPWSLVLDRDWKNKFFQFLEEFNSLKDSVNLSFELVYTYDAWIRKAWNHLPGDILDDLDRDHPPVDLNLV